MCLSLIASCCENDIVPHVLPFVEEHLQNPDWKFRDAAIMSLGVCVCACVCVCVCVCVCGYVGGGVVWVCGCECVVGGPLMYM